MGRGAQVIKSFMQQSKDQLPSLIRKALTSASGVGQPLVPEKLEEVITNTVVRLSPELAVMRARFDNQKTHEFNQVTTLPQAGGAMGEAATTPTRNSTYTRQTVDLKVIRRKGSITHFLQDAAANYVDSQAQEMENHLIAHVYDLNTYINFGNELADQYSFGGFDRFINTNRIVSSRGGEAFSGLPMLDEMIDRNLDQQGEGHPRVFMMSNRMLSAVSQALTNVRLNQGLVNGLTQVDIGGGWRLNAYRDIPIIATSGLRPRFQMGAVSTASSGSGGAITDDTWYFRVAPITYNGEEVASAEVSVTTSSADTITLSWSTPSTYQPLYYKIYAGTTSGQLSLVRMISAFNYDASGTITGDATSYQFSSDPDSADSTVPSHMQNDVPYTLDPANNEPEETIGLIDLHEYQGLGKLAYTNSGGSRMGGLVTIYPLAETDDFMPFLVKSYCAEVPSFEATSVWRRGVRTQ